MRGEGNKQIVVARLLVVLLDEQLHRRLGDRHQPRGVLCLGLGQLQGAVRIVDILFVRGDRPILDVQVIPPQGHQFPLPQTADQFQIKHGEQAPPLC